MSVSAATVVSDFEPLPMVGIKALITQLESKLVCAREGRSTYFALRTTAEYMRFRAMERECHARLSALREQARLQSRKMPRRVGRKTSFYDGKKKSKRKRKRDSSDDDDDEDEDDSHGMAWKKSKCRYVAVMERSYLHLSLRSLVGQQLSPEEADLLAKSRALVEDEDEEEEDVSEEVRERLSRSAWVKWLLSPSGPYTGEVAGLVEHGYDLGDVLGTLAVRPGGRVETVATLIEGNLVDCVCSWPGCPWLTHTLGSPEQRSCAWLCANAARYGLEASREPDDAAIREWLATPVGAVERMSARHAARVERVRQAVGVDTGGRGGFVTDRWNGVCDLAWHVLDVDSNTGWRKVLYGRAAAAEKEAAWDAAEAAAAEALEDDLLADNTFFM